MVRNMTAEPDIFDEVAEDVFDGIATTEETALENIKKDLVRTLEQFDDKERKKEKRQLSDELKDFIRAEIAKIKPTQNVIERVVEKKTVQPVPVHVEPKIVEAPPQVIKEVRVEVKTPTPDPKQAEMIAALQKKIEALEKDLKETRRIADNPIVVPGGPGVIGIPAPEPYPAGYVLTINSNRKPEWKVATATGGGSSTDAYTVSNGTTDRSFDADNTSLDELADVLGSLIASLQGAGIIQ